VAFSYERGTLVCGYPGQGYQASIVDLLRPPYRAPVTRLIPFGAPFGSRESGIDEYQRSVALYYTHIASLPERVLY